MGRFHALGPLLWVQTHPMHFRTHWNRPIGAQRGPGNLHSRSKRRVLNLSPESWTSSLPKLLAWGCGAADMTGTPMASGEPGKFRRGPLGCSRCPERSRSQFPKTKIKSARGEVQCSRGSARVWAPSLVPNAFNSAQNTLEPANWSSAWPRRDSTVDQNAVWGISFQRPRIAPSCSQEGCGAISRVWAPSLGPNASNLLQNALEPAN